MRTNLARYFRHLTLCSLAAIAGVCGQQTVRAHDLPNFIPYHELGADCLGVRTPPDTRQPQTPVAAVARPVEVEPTCPIKTGLVHSQQFAAQAANSIQALSRELYSGANACYQTVQHSRLLTAMPEDAPPPVPAPSASSRFPSSQLANATAAADAPLSPAPGTFPLVRRNYVEDYLPYDLCIRDWQFGRFSYRGLSRIAHLPQPVAEITEAEWIARAFPEEVLAPFPPVINTAHAEGLATALRNVESFQCQVCGEINRFDSAFALGSQLASTWKSTTTATADWIAQVVTPAAPPQPLFTSPQFVIYESAGKHFVLTVEQALAWQRIRKSKSAEQQLARTTVVAPTATASSSQAVAIDSLDTGLLKLASRQLASLGLSCLQLSSTLDSLRSQRLAAQSTTKLR